MKEGFRMDFKVSSPILLHGAVVYGWMPLWGFREKEKPPRKTGAAFENIFVRED